MDADDDGVLSIERTIAALQRRRDLDLTHIIDGDRATSPLGHERATDILGTIDATEPIDEVFAPVLIVESCRDVLVRLAKRF